MITINMLKKRLYNRGHFGISYLLVLFAVAGIVSVSPGQEASSLSLAIRLDKPRYVEGEEIPITSTLTNMGLVEMVVKEPFGLGLVVTFDIYRLAEDGKEIYIKRQLVGAGRPVWNPHIVQLQPGKAASSSYDLMTHYGRYTPGKYKIRGVYHLANFGSKDFNNPEFQVLSPYVNFEVVAPEGRMLEAFKLLNAMGSSEEMAWKLIRDYPDSPYAIKARLTLKQVYYQRKDYDSCIEQSEAILASNPTPMQRALTLFGEAMEYYYKGDVRMAIEKMRASGLQGTEAKAEEWAAATQ